MKKVTVKFLKHGPAYGYGYRAGEIGTFEVGVEEHKENLENGVYAPASDAEAKEYAKSNTVKETR